jgi:ParB family chromosome partitioning protein
MTQELAAPQAITKSLQFIIPPPTAVETLYIDQIVPNPFSSRQTQDMSKLAKFAAHLAVQGMLEPITVRVVGFWEEGELGEDASRRLKKEGKLEKYEIIYGWRRGAALKSISVLTIEATVYPVGDVTDVDSAMMSLSENLQRESLNPIDEVEAIVKLLSLKLELTVEEVERLLVKLHNSKNQKTLDADSKSDSVYNNVVINFGNQENGANAYPSSKLANQASIIHSLISMYGINTSSLVVHKLPLLNLPLDIESPVKGGLLTASHALLLKKVKNDKLRGKVLKEVYAKNYSVRELQDRIRKLSEPRSSPGTRTPASTGSTGGGGGGTSSTSPIDSSEQPDSTGGIVKTSRVNRGTGEESGQELREQQRGKVGDNSATNGNGAATQALPDFSRLSSITTIVEAELDKPIQLSLELFVPVAETFERVAGLLQKVTCCIRTRRVAFNDERRGEIKRLTAEIEERVNRLEELTKEVAD